MTTDTMADDARVHGFGHPDRDDVTGQFDRDVLLRCLADLG